MVARAQRRGNLSGAPKVRRYDAHDRSAAVAGADGRLYVRCIRMKRVIGALLALLMFAAEIANAAAQSGRTEQTYLVVSKIQNGPHTYDVKLKNPRTGYIHSVTVLIEIALRILVGQFVYKRRDPQSGAVILVPVDRPREDPDDPEEPPPPPLQRAPRPIPAPLEECNRVRWPNSPEQDEDDRRRRRRGVYCIDGLGTDHVRAFEILDNGTARDVSAEMQRRSDGENRPFRPDERLFDSVVGRGWNWVGSSVGGGRTDIPPTGIGDVNVPGVNPFDAAAKEHDIQSWLTLHFVEGTVVVIRINGRWALYRVQSPLVVHAGNAPRDMGRAAGVVLDRATPRAQRTGDRDLMNRIDEYRRMPAACAAVLMLRRHLLSRDDRRFAPELDKRAPEREPERPDGSSICRNTAVARAGVP